ncbi:MAG: HEPN domain-containing protein [Acidobacteriota bacterium]
MNKDIAVAMEKARDALEDARVLLLRNRNSGAVSRSYYAMYHAASAMLSREGLTVEKHAAVKAKFGESFVKPGLVDSKFGRYLNLALKLREDADYVSEGAIAITAQIAKEQVERAGQFLAMAEAFLSSR